MLERLKLFRNKNKNAGQAENAEKNVQKDSLTEEKEQQAEDKKVCHEINGKKECKVVKLHKKAEQVTTGDPSAPEAKPAKKTAAKKPTVKKATTRKPKAK